MLKVRFSLALTPQPLNINVAIPTHKITVLNGESGAGKTQFLRCIAGLNVPKNAFISYNNFCWQDDAQSIFIPPHQRDIGFVFQHPTLFSHLSVMNNLIYGYKRTPKEKQAMQPEEVIRGLGLSPLIQSKVKTLSGGQKQRISIARALLTSPQLLLMDEPLTSIDDGGKNDILSYLQHLQKKMSLTIIYVSHSKDEVHQIADNIVTFKEGQL